MDAAKVDKERRGIEACLDLSIAAAYRQAYESMHDLVAEIIREEEREC